MLPFSHTAALTVGALGEVRLITQIKSWLGDVTAPPPRGIGDDCAVLPAQPFPGERLVTTDSVIWARHFDASVPPRAVGAKLVKRNLSDIAAMGGTPADAVLSLVCGRDTSVAWLAEFFGGVADVCRRWRVELAGGDVAGAPDGFFCATLALTGFAEKPLQRLTAFCGDALLVTGELGGSIRGKHFLFEPHLAEGRWLAAQPGVHAGMDITDGLAKDLAAMLPHGTDALLDTGRIPVSAAAMEASAPLLCMEDVRRDALMRALCDGEDYELLIAAAPESVATLCAEWQKKFPALPLTPIGQIVSRPNAAQRLLDRATELPLCSENRGYGHWNND